MNSRLASDSFFRNLVRSILAYLQDPDEWNKEVEDTITKIVPRLYINTFKKNLLERNPHVTELSEYFDLLGLRNRPQLEKAIKGIYQGMVAPKLPVKVVEPKPKQEQKPQKSIIDHLKELDERQQATQNQDPDEDHTEDISDFLNRIRSKRAPVPRSACLKVVSKFLDTFE